MLQPLFSRYTAHPCVDEEFILLLIPAYCHCSGSLPSRAEGLARAWITAENAFGEWEHYRVNPSRQLNTWLN